jgi:outer membrane lipopolysaccharide assembly protein LptE/RlpB|tara:strand:- start:175 stop:624 length:450 start_codon:yes stop_codon:yes gene_type:complete
MIRKKAIIISLIVVLTSCGFTPIYLKNDNINFSIEQVNLTGDRELNNFLKTNFSRYKNKNIDTKIFIEAKSKYNKIILSKDGSGEVTNYQLEAEVIFLIKPTNKQILLSEKKIMESMSDKFEENKFEKFTKQNFASSITYKLISELIIN